MYIEALLALTIQAGQTLNGVQDGAGLQGISNLIARPLGPTVMGGRVTDLAVYEKAPRIFLVASASGGVWKTENAGLSFSPIFDKEGASSIGAVAISQSDPNVVWVGTGEGTHRNDNGWGDGIYKTVDGGKTWRNMGLPNSLTISHIVIDPKDNNIVLVGVLGSPWGYGPDRGVYRTTDGGKTWNKVLYVDEKTGAADLVMDPKNCHSLLAAMWENLRRPYSMSSGGSGCGLYRSTDGGASWHKVKGMPTPLGRVGLSYFQKDPHIVVATVEENDPSRSKGYPIGGSNLYRSTDGGESWKKQPSITGFYSGNKPSNVPIDDRPFYFSLPRQDPFDVNRVYVGSESIRYSDDMGKTFHDAGWPNHADYHALWIDPSDNAHMLVGEDGGVAQTRDKGVTWEQLNSIPIGQFYKVAFDMRKPYWVYGGLQDNGSWAVPTQGYHEGIADFDAAKIGDGDGFHVQVDPEDWTTVYFEIQLGFIYRLDQKRGDEKSLFPFPGDQKQGLYGHAAPGEGVRPSWNTPFILSSWNSHTLYYGASKLFRSVDRGETWRPISRDLTKNNPDWQQPNKGITPDSSGSEMYDTIITISESPLKQGTIWVGADDGNVQLTRDEGEHWANLTSNFPDLPANTWASRLTASRFSEGRAYATFDGHRNNDFKTYVYVTEDYGQSWKKLNGNLPTNETCYVIEEGLKNPNLLFLGTEFSLYISLDRGQTWNRYRSGGFPTVAIYDLEIQPREEDLIIGTHGRAIWILPIGALDELTPENLQKDVYFAHPGNVYIFGRNTQIWPPARWLSPNTQPGTLFCYYLKQGMPGDATLKISDPTGNQTFEVDGGKRFLSGTSKAGLNTIRWMLSYKTLPPGDYKVTLIVGGKDYLQTLRVEDVTDQQTTSPPRISDVAKAGPTAPEEDRGDEEKREDRGSGK